MLHESVSVLEKDDSVKQQFLNENNGSAHQFLTL